MFISLVLPDEGFTINRKLAKYCSSFTPNPFPDVISQHYKYLKYDFWRASVEEIISLIWFWDSKLPCWEHLLWHFHRDPGSLPGDGLHILLLRLHRLPMSHCNATNSGDTGKFSITFNSISVRISPRSWYYDGFFPHIYPNISNIYKRL